ncbi:MAG: glycosyltransferase [Candidatus Solibacter usitatus]|nr:glycosyltransferase [Candidatus Solibacter usitatus]
MLLSILVPVYNERSVVERSLGLVLAAPLPEHMERELIVVDDCSTDGTFAILQRLAAAEPRIRLYRHEVNRGKGAAVRSAIQYAQGDFVVVQDADLEYDPNEYPRLLRPLLDGRADAVFGSRYLAGEQTRVLPFWHSMINKHLTLLSNIFSNIKLTDMETCYKVFRTDLLKSIPIRSDRFGFEPEITMKSAKRKLRIYEVPISYHGRTYEEGKKIGWKDGLKALGVILRFWLEDDLYVQPYGRAFLNNLSGTPAHLSWITETIRPYLGEVVLELSAGIGNFAGRLLARRQLYVAAESDPFYLHALENRFLRTPNVRMVKLDPNQPSSYAQFDHRFDTVLCLNVLENMDSPETAVAESAKLLEPGGRLVVLVPHGRELFSRLDETRGHKRRFSRDEIEAMMRKNGFHIERAHKIAKLGAVAWWFFGKILRRKEIGKLWLKLFDKTVWITRRLNFLAPWGGMDLIVVGRTSK